MIKIISFSYKHQGPPESGFCVVDCRELPNPHNVTALRHLTGKHQDVKDYLWHDPMTAALLDYAFGMVKVKGRNIAFGCYGGRHRSVALAELLSDKLSDEGIINKVEHGNI